MGAAAGGSYQGTLFGVERVKQMIDDVLEGLALVCEGGEDIGGDWESVEVVAEELKVCEEQ